MNYSHQDQSLASWLATNESIHGSYEMNGRIGMNGCLNDYFFFREKITTSSHQDWQEEEHKERRMIESIGPDSRSETSRIIIFRDDEKSQSGSRILLLLFSFGKENSVPFVLLCIHQKDSPWNHVMFVCFIHRLNHSLLIHPIESRFCHDLRVIFGWFSHRSNSTDCHLFSSPAIDSKIRRGLLIVV